jgi:mono/diheme cytochrome c family protein
MGPSLRTALAFAAVLALAAAASANGRHGERPRSDAAAAARLIEEGRQTFREDTFGDEEFWGGQLRLHEAIAQLSPNEVLALGVKVDVRELPAPLVRALLRGRVDLDDPATTAVLLREGAVIGVTGFFDGESLTSVGIQCALCHSTVDDSVAEGVGRRRDGWANRDLDIGAIVASAPDLSPFADLLGVPQEDVRTVLRSWGPGKFDAALVLDGQTEGPQGSAAVLIPPAFGLAGVNLHTWTGWGSVPYWNAFVANLAMRGKGTFFDPRLDDAAKFPLAAREGFGHVRSDEDRITPKLAGLHLYQLSLRAPSPPPGSFDAAAAERGKALFSGKARCADCHVPPLFTEPGWNLHTGAELGIDAFQSSRSPAAGYRTAPLAGLWTHTQGGFYHDGRFATLDEVVAHYNAHFGLELIGTEPSDLVQYLLSLPEPEERSSRGR